MAKEFSLEVSKRELSNKGNLKNLRRKNLVPGIFYSHDSKTSIPFTIEKHILREAHKSGARIFSINVGDKKRTVIFKSVEYHSVTDEVLHIDLYGVKMDQAVTVNVEVRLIGSATGVTEGGILVQGLSEISIECFPLDIPEFIEVDVTELALGDSIRVEDLALGEKLKIQSAPEQILASVTHPMKEIEPEVVEEEEIDEEFIDEEGSDEQKDGEPKKPDSESGSSENDKKDSQES